MGRTKTKTKSSRTLQATTAPAAPKPAATTSKAPPSIPALVEKAQTLITQCDYDLATRFIQRILEHNPDHAVAREMLGVVQLETGELDTAKQLFESLLPPSSTAPNPPPPSAHLYLAQLSEDDPHLALQHYQSALDLLSVQLKGKERARSDANAAEDEESELRKTIVRALIGMVEIWMDPSYDLCFDPAAEKTCEDLLTTAMQTDPGNSEALQMLASVRMSQSRPDDAKTCALQAWSAWKDLADSNPDDASLPPIPTRLALARLFLELSLFAPALTVLGGVISADDEEVEAWYLEGWCFYIMAEQAKESGEKMDDLSWEELARDARDGLETCCVLHTTQDHPDKPLLGHAKELIGNLETMGIHAGDENDDGDGGAEGEGWEDADSDDGMELS